MTECQRCGVDIRHLRADAKYCSRGCQSQGWQRANPQNVSRWRLKTLYGLSPEDVAALLAAQGEACAICRTTEPTQWHVDHCHSTGVVRGVLCNTCNAALGWFHDDVTKLSAAIAYLERSRA